MRKCEKGSVNQDLKNLIIFKGISDNGYFSKFIKIIICQATTWAPVY